MKVQKLSNVLAIESLEGLPIDQLNSLVRVEGRGPEISRPPLYLHKWWARRFGSIFRSILLGLLIQDQDIWAAQYESHDFKDAIICDPFMGGGTTLFEATRLGAKVVGCDINPVAWWTTKAALSQPSSWSRLEETYEQINQEALDLFGIYYSTMCPDCNAPCATVKHVRWVRVLPCSHCNSPTAVFRSHVLGSYKTGHWLHCSCCGFVYWTEAAKSLSQNCPRCMALFCPEKGNTIRGSFTCSSCSQITNIQRAMASLNDPYNSARPFAILYDCPKHGWGLAEATDHDLKLEKRASEVLSLMEPDLAIPNVPISVEARTDPRPTNYGFSMWRQMFTPRQLLVLGWLAERTKKLPPEVRDTFATLVSQLTNYTNAFCVPRPNRPAAISWIFRLHAFVPPTDFVEGNPFAGESSSGTFQSLFHRSVRGAHEYRKQPRERRLDPASNDRTLAVTLLGEVVNPTLVDDWETLADTPHSALILCKTSESIPVPTGSISHIVTDPPFYDNVNYGELSEFNYVWLREMLGDTCPAFSAPSMNHQREIIQSKRIGKDDSFYQEGLRNVFTECNRILQVGGRLVFTFHHKTPVAWALLLEALTQAGFQISATQAVLSESDRSLHIMSGDAIEHDVVIVCLKATSRPDILWSVLMDRIEKDAYILMTHLSDLHRKSQANIDTVMFGLGVKLLSQFTPIQDETHKPIDFLTAIRLVQDSAISAQGHQDEREALAG